MGKKTHNYEYYDALVGAIINDKMYSTLSDYESGLLTKKQTIELLNIGGFSEQFVIKNKKTLDKLILASTSILSNKEKEKIKEQVINERITVSKMTDEYRRQAVKKGVEE